MNGVHDLGGMHGFGPVRPEADEPIFHADWERRVLAIVLAIGALGRWNIDQNRHARESLAPVTYLGSSYYRIWFLALLDNLAASGLVDPSRRASGPPQGSETTIPQGSGGAVPQGSGLIDPSRRASGPPQGSIAATWAQIDAGLRQGTPYDRPSERPAGFAVGETVRTLNVNPAGHTRLPRYARGRVGRVVLHHGSHVFPDRNAVPVGERGPGTGEHLYTIEFTGTELWGPDADPRLRVSIDAFEPYLEPAGGWHG